MSILAQCSKKVLRIYASMDLNYAKKLYKTDPGDQQKENTVRCSTRVGSCFT